MSSKARIDLYLLSPFCGGEAPALRRECAAGLLFLCSEAARKQKDPLPPNGGNGRASPCAMCGGEEKAPSAVFARTEKLCERAQVGPINSVIQKSCLQRQ